MLEKVVLELPWPLSNNTYWRSSGCMIYVTKKAQEYRKKVAQIVAAKEKRHFIHTDRLAVEIEAYPPNRIRRDLDNMLKVPLDALQKSGLFADDSQIDKITIERKHTVKDGEMIVTINVINNYLKIKRLSAY